MADKIIKYIIGNKDRTWFVDDFIREGNQILRICITSNLQDAFIFTHPDIVSNIRNGVRDLLCGEDIFIHPVWVYEIVDKKD